MIQNVVEKEAVSKSNQRIEHIDILKGIGILLMIMRAFAIGSRI